MASFGYDAKKNAPMHERLAAGHAEAAERLKGQGLPESAAAHQKASDAHARAAEAMRMALPNRRTLAAVAQNASDDAKGVGNRERAARATTVGVTADRKDHDVAAKEAAHAADRHEAAGNFREAQTQRDMARFHQQHAAAAAATPHPEKPHEQVAAKLEKPALSAEQAQRAAHMGQKPDQDPEQQRRWELYKAKQKGLAPSSLRASNRPEGIPKGLTMEREAAIRHGAPMNAQEMASAHAQGIGEHANALQKRNAIDAARIGETAREMDDGKPHKQLVVGLKHDPVGNLDLVQKVPVKLTGGGGHWETGPKGGTVWVTANGTRIYGRKPGGG